MTFVGTILPAFEQSPNATCPGCGSRLYEEIVGSSEFLCGITLREVERDGEWVWEVDGLTRDEVRCQEFADLRESNHHMMQALADTELVPFNRRTAHGV